MLSGTDKFVVDLSKLVIRVAATVAPSTNITTYLLT